MKTSHRFPAPASTAAIGASLALLAAPTSGQADDGRPKYAFLRYFEDWSGFAGTGDPFDPIKRISLNGDGSTWLSIGGRAEARLEIWDDFGFDPPVPNDDEFIVSRLLVHGDLHVGEDFRVFLEGKTAQATDRDLPGGRRALDLDTLALQQLFADVSFDVGSESRLTVRTGRQSLLFGKQRLISPLPWGNTLRTWEGIQGILDHGSWTTSAFATAFVPVDKTDFNERNDDELLLGVYAKRAGDPGEGLELYALANTRQNVVVNGTAGDAERLTLGSRVWGKVDGGFDWEAEAAHQLGEVGEADVSAGFATAELGWRPTSEGVAPRWFLGLDWASGDSSPGGDVGTFDSLYPLGHAYFGYIDAIGRQNIVATNVGVGLTPVEGVQLRNSIHSFWLEDRADALYNAGGGVVRAPGSFGSSHVGLEVDVSARWAIDRHLAAYAGYSHFLPGSAVEDSGPSADIDFVYFGLSFTF